jgi:hypothetical protein
MIARAALYNDYDAMPNNHRPARQLLLTNCPLAEMQKALRGVQGFMQEEEKKGGSSNGFGRGTICAS